MQHFNDSKALATRRAEVEAALAEVCDSLALIVSDRALSPLLRVRNLRSKSPQGHNSLYECLNQLTHYWYCCSAGLHLMDSGYTTIRMRPTGTDSWSEAGDAFDLVATHASGGTAVAEVFCVSPSLWRSKVSKSVAKLAMARDAGALRLVYYNQECKPSYQAKEPGFHFFGVSEEGKTVLIHGSELA